VTGCVDTYTAQATVGDINKGITNHKVYCSVSSDCVIWLMYAIFRTLNRMIPRYLSLVTVMAEEVHSQRC
jgi:hypothetical protein